MEPKELIRGEDEDGEEDGSGATATGTLAAQEQGRKNHKLPGIHTSGRMVRGATSLARTRKRPAGNCGRRGLSVDRGLVFDAENMALGEYLDRWLSGSVRGSVRQSTFDRYEIAVRVHIKPALGRIKLKKLTPAHVQGFYRTGSTPGFAPASVNKLHVVLHKALDQAVKWNMVPRNLTEVVKAPRPTPKEIHPLSAKRRDAARGGTRRQARGPLRAGHSHRDEAGRAAGPQVAGCGSRECHVSVRRTLTKSGGRLLLGEPKTRRAAAPSSSPTRRFEALHEHLDRQMEAHSTTRRPLRDEGLVFASEVGTLINPTNLRRRSFASLLKRAGLPKIRFHDLRHTCATLLLCRNVHPKFVQELLGHANIAITLDTYSHVIPGMGDYAVRAMEDALS